MAIWFGLVAGHLVSLAILVSGGTFGHLVRLCHLVDLLAICWVWWPFGASLMVMMVIPREWWPFGGINGHLVSLVAIWWV